MAVSLLENIVFSVFDLLKGAVFVAIPLFVLIYIGKFLRESIEKETKKSWFITALASTFFICFALLLIVYFLPGLSASNSYLGQVPSVFSEDFLSVIVVFFASVIKVLIASTVLTLLLMPLEFAGAFFHAWISQRLKKYPEWVCLAITAYVSALFSSAVILFFFPEAIAGFFYLLYF